MYVDIYIYILIYIYHIIYYLCMYVYILHIYSQDKVEKIEIL